MTNYKNNMRHIGASDAAALVMVGISEQQMKSQLLHFAKTGAINATFATRATKFPSTIKQ